MSRSVRVDGNADRSTDGDSGSDAASAGGDRIEIAMLGPRANLETTFKIMVNGIFVMIVMTAAVVVVMGFLPAQDFRKIIIVRLIQISFAMILGAACIIFGVLLSWLGIDAAFSVTGERSSEPGSMRLAFSSTSPGIALILGGIVLIGMAIFKDVSYEETEKSVGTRLEAPAEPRGARY